MALLPSASSSHIGTAFGLHDSRIKTGHRSTIFHVAPRMPKRELPNHAVSLRRDTHTITRSSALAPSRENLTKGWMDSKGVADEGILEKLSTLSVLATDRSEMHNILSLQRDNWNHLLHSTITIACVSAATAAAVNGLEHSLALSMVATILNAGCTVVMSVVNTIQPSQLAEEQRAATRFFKRLARDIDSTLQIDHHLRQDAALYWQEKVETLYALDDAFPLPLTPTGLEKFPTQVLPSKVGASAETGWEASHPDLKTNDSVSNGWTDSLENDLRREAHALETSDVRICLKNAEVIKSVNSVLAKASPILAAAGAGLSMVDSVHGVHSACLSAACTVGALFTHTLAHGMQMGMMFEVSRNCAGYYKDVENSIRRTLHQPTQLRENGVLYHKKIALQLFRKSTLADN